jgi:hypothetical protein
VFVEKASIELAAETERVWRYSAKYFIKCIPGTAERREIGAIA